MRKRLTRELGAYVSDSLRVPVIGKNELQAQYLFDAKHALRLLALGSVAALSVVLVFQHQAGVLRFLSAPGVGHRILATAVLAVFVPLYASVYGSFTQYLLRLLKFE